MFQNLVKKGFTVNVEADAGELAKFKNEDYEAAGAIIKVRPLSCALAAFGGRGFSQNRQKSDFYYYFFVIGWALVVVSCLKTTHYKYMLMAR